MPIPDVATVDFESAAIEQRPVYPPKPTSVSIILPGDKKPRFLSWGHPEGNNCNYEDAKRAVQAVWRTGLPILCHNAKFDLDVAETHMGCPAIGPDRIHDTQFLLFLNDPYSRSLALKPSAKKLLGMEPEEKDAVADWLIANKVIKSNQRGKAGAYISQAPGDVVGPYANGDTWRTYKIFRKLYPEIQKRGMQKAYERELKLMPILLRNEREGIRVDLQRLRKDVDVMSKSLKMADDYLRKRLKSAELNLDSKEELAEALKASGYADALAVTPKGQLSTSKESLDAAVKDKRILHTLHYRARCANQLRSFMVGWLQQAELTGGTIHTSWHQTRNGEEGFLSGARTGRLSTDKPNLLAVTKKLGRKAGGAVHPDWLEVVELPHLRSYLLPDDGHVWCRRDYNQQEYRILGHFEDGPLKQAYIDDPRTDVHNFVQASIQELLNLTIDRDNTKTINFGMLYGLGLKNLAIRLQKTMEEAKTLKQAQLSVLPGLKDMQDDLRERDKNREPIHTWGGREYYAEEPKLIDGEWKRYGYKLLNYLIQGSAADCTKEALIRYDAATDRRARLLAAVHDEVNISAPIARRDKEMRLLRDIMASVEFDVPMLSDGEYGSSWGTLQKWSE